MSYWEEHPDPDAKVATAMCGSTKVCEHCPSHFLCYMKVQAELETIQKRKSDDDNGH